MWRPTAVLLTVLLAPVFTGCSSGNETQPRAVRPTTPATASPGPHPRSPARQPSCSPPRGSERLPRYDGHVSVARLRYGSRPEQTMQLFTPAGRQPSPAVLFVHGGAWTRAWPLPNEIAFARRIAATTGWVVGVPGYDTSTSPGAVVQPRDVERALSMLRADPHVDARRVALWGESAGGNLSLLVAAARPRQVQAVVSVSGPTDMRYEYLHVGPVLRREINRFEGGTPRQRPDAYRLTSPVRGIRADHPPTLLATSRYDRVVPSPQQHRLRAALQAAGVPCRLAVVAGAGHSSTIESQRVLGAGGTVRDVAIAFLATRFHRR